MNSIRTIFGIIFFLSIFSNVYGQFTLDSCQQLARRNYPAIKQLELIEASKEMTVSNAVRNYLPHFEVAGIAGVIKGLPNFSLPGQATEGNDFQLIGIAQLSQPIWDGGYTHAQKKTAEAEALIQEAQIEVLLQTVKERVNQLFFGILMINEQLKQLDLLDSNLNLALKRAETAFINGSAFQSDVDLVKVEKLNVKQNSMTCLTEKQAYEKMLLQMIGQSDSEPLMLTLPEMTDEDVFSAAPQRAELTLYENQKQWYESQNLLINAGLMPKISLMGFAVGLYPGKDVMTEKLDHLFVGGLNVSWNIAGLYTAKNNRDLLKNNILKVENQEETFRFNLNMQLEELKAGLNKTKQLLIIDQEKITLQGNIAKAAMVKYENGTYTISELIKELNAESLVKLNMLSHQLDYRMKWYQYQTLLGR